MSDADRARSIYRAIQRFAGDAQDVSSLADLGEAVADVSAWLGFERFAMVHHVDFGRVVPTVRLTNYPVELIGRLREVGLRRDPVLRASERSGVGFSWDQLPALIPFQEADAAYMTEAVRHGLGNGFTVPNHLPGELPGSCHFAVGSTGELPRAHLAAVQSIGAFGFEAARRLAVPEHGTADEVDHVPLSDRQRECLIQVARGKSDSVIAELLGLRPRTVNEYIEGAKRRYLVATRQQLVVRALFRSEISFSEILH